MGRKSTDTRFMVLFAVIGLIVFIMSTAAHSNVPKNCSSNIIRDGLTTVTIVSAILLTIGISYIICNFGLPFGSSGHDCYPKKKGDNQDTAGEFYLSICAFISLSMSILLMVMGINLSKKSDCGDDKDGKGRKLKFYVWSMFALYMIVFILSIVGLWYIVSHIPSWAASEDKGQKDEKKREKPAGFLKLLMGNESDESDDTDELDDVEV